MFDLFTIFQSIAFDIIPIYQIINILIFLFGLISIISRFITQVDNMRSLRTLQAGSKLLQAPRFTLNHIKNMVEENIRAKAQQINNYPQIETNNRVYKPTYTIQFNRQGQVLLYSANPLKQSTLYFKYPYIFYQSFIPLSILNYVLDPFGLAWYWSSFFLYFSPLVTIPRVWYFADFKWHPMKMFLLRGGRVIKVQANSVGGQMLTYWMETFVMKPLTQDKMRYDDKDEADFLTDQGQLRYDLTVQTTDFKFFGVNTNNQQLYFLKDGTVHHPQLFQAAVKGYNIDTTDFVINTADNVRYRESSHNL